jgi:hypothetical protein
LEEAMELSQDDDDDDDDDDDMPHCRFIVM